MSDLQVRFTRAPEEVAACLDLRRAVFVDEQGVPADMEVDADDAHCLHVIVMAGCLPVGTARLLIEEVRDARIGRVCVLGSHRGTGVGAAIMRFALDHLAGRAGTVRLAAQTDALPFYAAFGFVPIGEPFVEEGVGIAHQQMQALL